MSTELFILEDSIMFETTPRPQNQEPFLELGHFYACVDWHSNWKSPTIVLASFNVE